MMSTCFQQPFVSVCVVRGQSHYKGIMGSCPQYPEALTQRSLFLSFLAVWHRKCLTGRKLGGMEVCVHTCMWLCVYVQKDRRKTFLHCESDAKVLLVDKVF